MVRWRLVAIVFAEVLMWAVGGTGMEILLSAPLVSEDIGRERMAYTESPSLYISGIDRRKESLWVDPGPALVTLVVIRSKRGRRLQRIIYPSHVLRRQGRMVSS